MSSFWQGAAATLIVEAFIFWILWIAPLGDPETGAGRSEPPVRNPSPPEIITEAMMHEAFAHVPFSIENEMPPVKWQWFADFLNQAIADPNKPCPCCNVTPAGDVCDHLPSPALRPPTAPL